MQRTSFARLTAAFGLSATLAYLPAMVQAANGQAFGHQHAHHAHHAHTERAAKSGHAKEMAAANNDFRELKVRWLNADKAQKKELRAELVKNAKQRRDKLRELMKANPAAALEMVVSDADREGLPQEVLDTLEQSLELEGELESRYEDFADGSHELVQALNNDGTTIALHTAHGYSKLNHGSQVRAKGWLLADEDGSADMLVDSGSDDILMLELGDSADGGSNGGSVGTLANTTGDQRTLVMLVNFQDDTSQPYSRSQVQNLMFNEVNQFYQENSFGQTSLSGDVTNWSTIPVSRSSCSTATIASEAQKKAIAQGYNPSAYTRLVYVFPKNACGFSGTATTGGNPSQAWINGEFNLKIVSHEMGHNFGLHHSHSLNCTNGSVIGAGNPTIGYGVDPYPGCSTLEYGDGVDVMGWSASAHFSSYQKEMLGWLPSIQTVTSSGDYTIYPYAAQTNQTKALKILKSVDPSTGQKTWYYVEFRQPIGFDSIIGAPYMSGNLLDTDNVLNGVIVHAKYDVGGNMGYLLDMTPNTYHLYSEDPALTVGRSFHSPDGDLTITTQYVGSDKAIVSVDFGDNGGSGGGNTDPQPTCTRANPTVTATPTSTSGVAAGTQRSYSVTVRNNDSSACSVSTYSMNASKPYGWSTSFSSSSLSLSPGASSTTTLYVTSSSSASDGSYNIVASAGNGSYSGSTSVSYTVSNPVSNSAPVAVNDSASTTAGTSVSIPVLANDYDADGDSLTITGTSGVNGSAYISGGNVVFTPASGFSGTEVFYYSISDGKGGSDTGSVTVTVQASSSNSAPVAVNDSASTTAGTSVSIPVLANDYDADGDSLTITGTSGVNGSAYISGGNVVFTPASGFSGTEVFYYSISDGKGGSDTGSVTVNVSGGSASNSAPVANGDYVTLTSLSSTAIAVLANDYDADGDKLTITGVTQGSKGSVTISNGQLVYTPGKRFKNADSFTYTISDGKQSASATVSVRLDGGSGGKGNGKGGWKNH